MKYCLRHVNKKSLLMGRALIRGSHKKRFNKPDNLAPFYKKHR